MNDYASVIVEINHTDLDRTFQYRIPDEWISIIKTGSCVRIPFGKGNRLINGYVIGFSNIPEIDPSKIKSIHSVETENLSVEAQLMQLAGWMREYYGCTMIQAIKTVMPVKEAVRPLVEKTICLLLSEEELAETIAFCEKKHYIARLRLLTALSEDRQIPYGIALNRLNLTANVINPMVKAGWIMIEETQKVRSPLCLREDASYRIRLNEEQSASVDRFREDRLKGKNYTYLLHGITGSGKTEVYMEMIDQVITEGKQVIVLIPEIALTYQTVMRFYRRFGDVVALVNSKMSKGERFDQFSRAEKGEASIMIGPRSALFTPFSNLGLIIIDEEHEHAYKSENVPRYHAKEVAAVRAELSGASIVLGSATPSVSDYYRAMRGEYTLLSLPRRAVEKSRLPEVEVIDLREELLSGNKQIFSRRLKELMEDRLSKNEQIMLFLNRRGYSGFISCRSCGKAIKCDHCDVAMTTHRGGRMTCHYCGSEKRIPKVCPSCGSPYIAGFGTGTEKVEQLVREIFPQARVLRMDMDTTAKKGSHEAILSAFAHHEADILVGTQMIVKGHDFPNVTLVGVLAADLSLFAQDYTASANTFNLLTQAAGRAGRGDRPGNVVIQTYNPEEFPIVSAATQDYPGFYRQEILYRRMLKYPPFYRMLTVQYMSEDERLIEFRLQELARLAGKIITKNGWSVEILGPTDENISKVKDIYRKVIYFKSADGRTLELLKKQLETAVQIENTIQIQYDWNED
ncbi:MAG: primosomal protein N' [Lachnospiraceae bacterium]|nr:primosomal protein N' [Lachnospiraceae bacterium]